jgi:hypothetical protein
VVTSHAVDLDTMKINDFSVFMSAGSRLIDSVFLWFSNQNGMVFCNLTAFLGVLGISIAIHTQVATSLTIDGNGTGLFV